MGAVERSLKEGSAAPEELARPHAEEARMRTHETVTRAEYMIKDLGRVCSACRSD
jgi:hypothetical protein